MEQNSNLSAKILVIFNSVLRNLYESTLIEKCCGLFGNDSQRFYLKCRLLLLFFFSLYVCIV